LTRVSSFTAHDANEGAEHHSIAVVNDLTFADSVKEGFMLQVIHVFFFAFVAPALGSVDERGAAFANDEGTFFTANDILIVSLSAFDLAVG
jgi:hypothetical protein